MLECGKNFKGTLPEICTTCNSNDDEEHRLNVCINHSNVNFAALTEKLAFDNVFSTDVEILRKIIRKIHQVWNVKSGQGTMHS